MHSFFMDFIYIDVPGLSKFPDFFAFGVTMIFAFALAFGAKESSIVNNIFTFLNLSVVLFVIIAGSFKANPANWSIPSYDVEPECGMGGFAPYGVGGILKGAATCFYGFIGFDCIATAGEEAKNPKRSIPIAIIGSLTVIFFAYFGISTVLTMMLPYYQQVQIENLSYIFKYIFAIFCQTSQAQQIYYSIKICPEYSLESKSNEKISNQILSKWISVNMFESIIRKH